MSPLGHPTRPCCWPTSRWARCFVALGVADRIQPAADWVIQPIKLRTSKPDIRITSWQLWEGNIEKIWKHRIRKNDCNSSSLDDSDYYQQIHGTDYRIIGNPKKTDAESHDFLRFLLSWSRSRVTACSWFWHIGGWRRAIKGGCLKLCQMANLASSNAGSPSPLCCFKMFQC
jgi:hypothetical protein